MANNDNADKLIDKIVGFSQTHGDLLQKYNINFYLNYFDRNTILAMNDHVQTHQQLTIQQFIRIFLLKIDHKEQETLYLALSLKKLFQSILQRTSSTITIQFSDFTTYLCQKISNEDLDVVIPSKRIAKQSSEHNTKRIRQIDLQPPIIINKIDQQIPKINRDLPRKNKKLEEKKSVSKFYYALNQKNIVAVGTLSSSIHIYDENLKDQLQIRPNQCKEMDKDIGILSMAYSQRNNRIGAILTNSTLIFWEGVDNFTTQKIIPNKNYGDKIFYFQQANQWITVDKSLINIWNIKEENVAETIKCKNSVMITDICEINHLRGICASVVTNKQEKMLMIFHEGKLKARINLDNSGCHSLHYNKLTQSLIPLGYHNNISVYTIQSAQFDIQLKFILRGHRSIITCVDSLQHNTLMVTGDDIGQIRVWQLTYMRCVQSVKITKWLGGIKLIGNKLFYSDSRINVIYLDHFQVPQNQKLNALYQFYDEKQEQMWVITKKDARKISIRTGKISKIFILCGQQEQISAATKIGNGFVIGNTKGQLYHYNSDCNIKWQKNAHDSQITDLKYDQKNRLLFSITSEGKIMAWPERTIDVEDERKAITYKQKLINSFSVSNKSNLLVVGNTQEKDISIWDYQILKLYEVLTFEQNVTSFLVSDRIDLLIVCTRKSLFFIKFIKRQHNLDMQLLEQVNIWDWPEQSNQFLQQDEELSSIELIYIQSQSKYNLLFSTSKGQLINIDPSDLIQSNFPAVNHITSYQSVNILRNQKEDYQSSFNQCSYKNNIQSLRISAKRELSMIRIIWSKRIFKEAITKVSIFTMRDYLLSVIGQDYCKIINLDSGEIQASLNINLPLPVKWNMKLDKHCLLKKDVYDILKTIDNILKYHGYEMLAREYKLINITNFMEMIKDNSFQCFIEKEDVQLLSSQYKPKDFKGLEQPQMSLKALQAYKRVKMIKKISDESLQISLVDSFSNKQAQIEKDLIKQILAPSEISRYVISAEKHPFVYQLVNKLTQSLPIIDTKKPVKYFKQPKQHQAETSRNHFERMSIKQNNTFKEITNLSKSINFYKEKKQQFEKAKEKGLKEMLGELNSKLKICRKKNTRQI